MKLLVIGNGFDLAHDLLTSYGNFLDFINEFSQYFVRGDKYQHGTYHDFIKSIEGTPVFNEIKEHINTSGRLLMYFLSIYKDRIQADKKGWIDFEKELSTIVRALEQAKTTYDEQRYDGPVNLPKPIEPLIHELLLIREGTGAYKFPDEFEDGRANELLDGLNRITRLLEIYLVEYVEKQKIKKRLPGMEGFTHILSFNYTDIYQKLYDRDCRASYCYIHGKADKASTLDNCNLVLGINEHLDQWQRDDENQFVWFKKFYQRIYKGTGSEYRNWLDDFDEMYGHVAEQYPGEFMNEVHIFGHSLDATDKDILARLITEKMTETIIYYKDKADLGKKIENLVKVIGEDELIERTGGNNQSIRFVEIGKEADKKTTIDALLE